MAEERRRWLVIAFIALSQFASAFMHSIVGVPLPTMAREFGASGLELSLLDTVFLGAAAALLMPIGRFADATDKNSLFKWGLIGLGIATFAIGLQPTMMRKRRPLHEHMILGMTDSMHSLISSNTTRQSRVYRHRGRAEASGTAAAPSPGVCRRFVTAARTRCRRRPSEGHGRSGPCAHRSDGPAFAPTATAERTRQSRG